MRSMDALYKVLAVCSSECGSVCEEGGREHTAWPLVAAGLAARGFDWLVNRLMSIKLHFANGSQWSKPCFNECSEKQCVCGGEIFYCISCISGVFVASPKETTQN